MSQLTYSSSENNNNWCLLCRLCNNNNPNPWHTTTTCPLKDPTFILHEGIHENALQHNSLHGKLNKNYKKKDLPSNNNNALPAIIPAAHNALLHDNPCNHPSFTLGSSDQLSPPLDTVLHLPTGIEESISYSNETVIDTTTLPYHPFLPSFISLYLLFQILLHLLWTNQSPSNQDLIFDPTDFLHVNSWLVQAPSSNYHILGTSIEHDDGGVNCRITNNFTHFTHGPFYTNLCVFF